MTRFEPTFLSKKLSSIKETTRDKYTDFETKLVHPSDRERLETGRFKVPDSDDKTTGRGLLSSERKHAGINGERDSDFVASSMQNGDHYNQVVNYRGERPGVKLRADARTRYQDGNRESSKMEDDNEMYDPKGYRLTWEYYSEEKDE